MAKRVPPHETPYRPVDDALVRAVLSPETKPVPPTVAIAETAPPPAPRLIGIPVQKEPESSTPDAPPAMAAVEKLTHEKRVLLTPTEEWEWERLVRDIAAELRTPLKSSHVLRAAVILLRHAGEELVKQSRRVGPLKRPPNNDPIALAGFEHYLAEVIDSALRNAPPLR